MFLAYRLLVLFSVVLYCSNAYLFLYNEVATSMKPLYWYCFTIGSSAALALLSPNSLLREIPRYLIVWLWVFICHAIVNFFYSSQSANALQALIYRFESAALLASFLVLFFFQKKSGLRTAQFGLVLVTLFGVVMNVIDFISPTWSNVVGRAAGFYFDPNISGAFLLLAMTASVSLIKKTTARLLYCFVAGIGILLTFSRGAWLLWVIAMVGLAGTGYFKFMRKKYTVILMGALASFILYTLFTGGLVEVFTSLGLRENLNETTLGRLGANRDTFGDTSAESRSHIAAKAWQLIQERPWLGYGVGFTRGSEWGYKLPAPHNMYLEMLVQGGLLALAVFACLLIILWSVTNPNGKLLIVLISAFSIVNHNVLDMPGYLLIFALIAAMGRQQSKSVPNTARERDYPAIPDQKVKSASIHR
jgi:O-antigen ligase